MKKLKLVVNNVSNSIKDKEIFFIKKELQTILNLYGKMVSNGAWKDYGMSISSKEISFDVYQRSSEKPVYRILKTQNIKERFYIQDKNWSVIEKSSNLLNLIKKTRWNNLKAIK